MISTFISGSVVLSNCGGSHDGAQILNMSWSPQVVSPGVDTELTIGYALDQPFTGGKAKYTYKVNGLPFAPTYEDLCTQTECPKESGDHVEVSKSTWPDFSGSLVSTISWTNQNGLPLWCIQMNVGASEDLSNSDSSSGSSSSSSGSSSSSSGSSSSSSSGSSSSSSGSSSSGSLRGDSNSEVSIWVHLFGPFHWTSQDETSI